MARGRFRSGCGHFPFARCCWLSTPLHPTTSTPLKMDREYLRVDVWSRRSGGVGQILCRATTTAASPRIVGRLARRHDLAD